MNGRRAGNVSRTSLLSSLLTALALGGCITGIPGENGGDDGDRLIASRRIDRISFYNTSGDPVTVELEILDADEAGNPVPVPGLSPKTLADVPPHESRSVLLRRDGPPGPLHPENTCGARRIRCRVGDRVVELEAGDGMYLRAASFWFFDATDGTSKRLCGQALRSDGTSRTTE